MTEITIRTKYMSADGQTSEPVRFFCPEHRSGYVFYQTPDMRERRQLCERAGTMGNALESRGDRLAADVRRALRLARYDSAKWAGR